MTEGPEIATLLTETGPLTGAELLERTGMEPLGLWRLCTNEANIRMAVVGRRYLRLDRNVEGYARLSPSIRREFLTYTLLDHVEGGDGQNGGTRLDDRAAALSDEIARISEGKRRLAAQTVGAVVDGLAAKEQVLEKACFILAGDIVYNMAHRVPRPERSTGRLVKGSDLDIVIVADGTLDPETQTALDDAMYQRKYHLLINPSYREELDYLIKDLATVRKQVEFDTFQHMVACKILDEGEFLHGSAALFARLKGMLDEADVPRLIADLEERAAENRARAESTLRLADGDAQGSEFLNLFFTTDEGDEIY